jgi:peptidoglycan-N-acetylglucosamine deacetylase
LEGVVFFRSRLLVMAIALGVTGAFSAVPAIAAPPPPSGSEGPAGPPAQLPNGRAASPPQVTAPVIATSCPAAPYGARSYAPGSGKTVALTFDDGPGPSTAGILSVLASYRVPATFFNLGQNMAARPALVRQEASAGYTLGNHTWDHPNMITQSASAQASEMDRASAEQQSLTGIAPCAFRPPYGNYNSTTLSLAQQRRMTFWTWSVDTEDWKANGSSSSSWVNRIISLAESEGGVLQHPVVLMHNAPSGDPATVLALPTIIRYFRDHGYTFVDVYGRTGALTADVAAVSGKDRALYANEGRGWRLLGGTLLFAPAVTVINGEPYYFAVSGDHNVWVRTDRLGWRKFGPAGTNCASSPGVTFSGGRLYLACTGPDRRLRETSSTVTPGTLPHVSTGFGSLGGTVASAPAVAAVGSKVTFFVGTPSGIVYTRTLSTGWHVTGWRCMSPPAAAQSASGTGATFACIGTDHNLWYAPYTTSHGWYAASHLGPPSAEGFSAGALGVDANVPRFAVTGAITSHVYTGAPDAAWTSLSGATIGGVALSSP